MVSKAAAHLTNQACTLSARHLKDGALRSQFNREVAYYAKCIVDKVAQGKLSPEEGLREINEEQKSLLTQSLEIAQKSVGVIAGTMQFAAGAGICYGSAGTLCLFMGIPLMAHGTNNVYESGRNLLQSRSDTQGPLRKGYQATSKLLGGGESEGNMAYGAVDIGTSLYGMGRLVLKPDAWRLSRYLRTDYVRAYENAGSKSLAFEATSNVLTGRSMYLENKKNDK